jgi:CheY-like chemotaxis protein
MAVKARILIADDNAGLRETLSLVLRERGCDVATAAAMTSGRHEDG